LTGERISDIMEYMRKFIFRNYGGSYQLRIQTPEDLKKVLVLPDSLWAATSIPVEILNCDKKFLIYLDTDKNGRIRTDEMRQAISWILKVIKNHSCILDGTDTLSLKDINRDIPEGEKLYTTAKRILTNLNLEDKEIINLSQVRDLQKIMAGSATNGDGIITPDATEEKEVSEFIKDVMDTVGTVMDASGKLGIGEEQLNLFLQEAKDYLNWISEKKIPEGKTKTEIMFLKMWKTKLMNISFNVQW